jgi:WD40 repeat protein
MASGSTKAVGTKSILTPSITLKGHGGTIQSISYFPDGQRMISGSEDKTARQWDVKAGKEIEEVRSDCEERVCAVAVSRNGRWIATGGEGGELKVCEETGIVKTFKGHLAEITCIDISGDNTLLASGSWDATVRIWNVDTGKLVAGLKSEDYVGAVQFSPDSKKLTVRSLWGRCLEVWDVQSKNLDVKINIGKGHGPSAGTRSPIFWTNNNKTIITAFRCADDVPAKIVYEFDASTLEIVGTPFEGHTSFITGLALSFDQGLLASSASRDNTIKLWAFESRQLLASFDVQHSIYRLVLSPDSRQLAYTVDTQDHDKIFICDTPPDVLAQARVCILPKHVLFIC